MSQDSTKDLKIFKSPIKILAGSIIVFILLLSVAYSLMNQSLYISGEVIFIPGPPPEVIVTDIDTVNSICGNDNSNPEYSYDTILMDTNLASLSCYMEYEVDIYNQSLFQKELDDILTLHFSNQNMVYEFDGLSIGHIIDPGETYTFTVRLKYNPALQTLPNNTNIRAMFMFQWKNPAPITFTINYDINSWTNQNVNATIVFDDLDIAVTNNSGNSYQFNANGSFTYHFENSRGVKGNATTTVTWIDKIPPTAFSVSQTAKTTSSISVSGSTTDTGGSGMQGYQFSCNNGSSWSNVQGSGSYTCSGLAQDTSYTIIQRAIDNAGNITTSNVTIKTKKKVILTFYTPVVYTDASLGDEWTNRTHILGIYSSQQTSFAYSQRASNFARYAYYEMRGIGINNSYDSSGQAVTIPAYATITSGTLNVQAGDLNDGILYSFNAKVVVAGGGGNVTYTRNVGTNTNLYFSGILTSNMSIPNRGANIGFSVLGEVANGGVSGNKRVLVTCIYATWVAEWEED